MYNVKTQDVQINLVEYETVSFLCVKYIAYSTYTYNICLLYKCIYMLINQ